MTPTTTTPGIDRARCWQGTDYFYTDVLGWHPTAAARAVGHTSPLTPDQTRIVQSAHTHRRTAVLSGHGTGKTHILAGLALEFLYAHPGSKVITTAPTAFQVEHLLWREIRRAYHSARVPLGGRLLTTQLELAEDWFAVGLSPARGAEEDTAVRFQGFHAPRVMVLLDEAPGVHPAIWNAAEGLAVGPGDCFVAAGNPTDPTCYMKQACDSGRWNVLQVSCLDHPNVLHHDPAIIPGAVTEEWITEHLEDYGGPDSPMARARIFGKWPEQGDDMLISLRAVEAAQAAYTPPAGAPAVVGCDVARFGTDATLIYGVWPDGTVARCYRAVGQDLMATVGQLQATGAPLVLVDDTGVGGGVTDRLHELSDQGTWAGTVVPVNFGAAPLDPKFANRRAECYWLLRDTLIRLHLPADPRLSGDLTTVKYKYDSRSRVLLEPKDAIKKRLGRSPDDGDALALAVMGWTGGYTREVRLF